MPVGSKIAISVILFRGKTHADGTHPIQLKYSINGVSKKKGIYKCLPKDWDDKTKRIKSKVTNSAYINSIITEKYSEYERELIKVMNGHTASDVLFEKENIVTLDSIILREIKRYKLNNKISAYNHWLGHRIELAEFTDTKKLNIDHIDINWFQRLALFLTTDRIVDGKKRRGNIGSTAQRKLKMYRRIVEKYSTQPLSDEVKTFRIPSKRSVKQKLTAAELKRIEDIILPEGQQISVVRNIFLLQVYLRGSRIGAILMAYSDQFKDGRYIAANGTGKNNVGSKLIPRAQQIVDKYYGKYERLFPIYSWQPNPKLTDFENEKSKQKKKEAATTIVNKYLKKLAVLANIDKPLTTHIARHTFARMAIDKINNPMVTMELLGHSSLAVHQVYLNDIRRDDLLDKANDEIFN